MPAALPGVLLGFTLYLLARLLPRSSLSVLFGKQPNAGLLALPLIVYHASQVLQGSALISFFKRWEG